MNKHQTHEQAIRILLECRACAELLRGSYLGGDPEENALRFSGTGEFAEVLRLTAPVLRDGLVLDLGAGTGMASWAFAGSGARRVIALEPDPSDLVGYGSLRRIAGARPLAIVAGVGERIPVADAVVDLVYARQVFHHARDLRAAARECARIMRPGGLLLACREHVVDNARQKEAFLRSHPVHQLTGGENAHPLDAYQDAFTDAGLEILSTFAPWDSLINGPPALRNVEDLRDYPARVLRNRLGAIGAAIHCVPGLRHAAHALIWKHLKRKFPGRLYSFLAVKPPRRPEIRP